MSEQKVRRFEADYLQRVPYSKRALLEENIVNNNKCFYGSANLRCRKLAGKFDVAYHSSSAMFSCHKAFAVVRTSS